MTKCKYCGVLVSNSNGNTTRMLHHLRNKHSQLIKDQLNQKEIDYRKPSRSLVWDFFEAPVLEDRMCSYCGERFSNSDESKTEMMNHLQTKHPNEIQDYTDEIG